MEEFGQYYFIDTIGVCLSLLQIYLLGNKNKWGFVSGISANICWLIVGILIVSYALIIGNVVILILNARGLLKWEYNNKLKAN